MDAQNYADWCDISGIYLDQVSHYDRYRTYAKHLSKAGLNTVIVWEFLRDNHGELNIQGWRSYAVYEMGDQQQKRIDMTADALRAIGAHRIAEAVQTSEAYDPFAAFKDLDPSDPGSLMDAMQNVNPMDLLKQIRESAARMMPEIAAEMGVTPEPQTAPESEDGAPLYETRAELEQRLEEYVTIHQKQLQDDLKKYGDPREEPGYSRKGRLDELEQEHRRQYTLEYQKEDLPKFKEIMQDIRSRAEDTRKPVKKAKLKLEQARRQFKNLIEVNKRRYAQHPLPEMKQMLEKAAEFMGRYPQVFDRKPTEDARLNKEFAALGEYDVQVDSDMTRISWPSPAGLRCPWHQFSLTVAFPGGDPDAARSALQIVDRLKQRLPVLADEWREELIGMFRNYEAQMMDWEIEDYELNDDGEVTEDSILENTGTGNISIELYSEEPGDLSTMVWFNVEWDEEHGCELYWEDEPPPEVKQQQAEFSTASVQFLEPGPALAEEQIKQFENKFDVKIPDEYRRFLLQQNGGIPQPGHLILRQHGSKIPYDVNWFYSIATGAGTVPEEKSLQSIIETVRAGALPDSLLPIAKVEMVSQGPFPWPDSALYLVTSGKKAGQVLLLPTQNPMMQLVADPQMFLEQMIAEAPTAARNLSELFEKLQSRPSEDLPDWLRFIRHNDTDQFLSWLDKGGNLQKQHTAYGEPMPKSVIDYLALEASVELLEELLQRNAIKPAKLMAGWQLYARYDVDRFLELTAVLPEDLWPGVFNSPAVWDRPDVLEELADADIDIDAPIDDEGATALHKAVQMGHQEAVKWLLAHGADPRKNDKYRRNALLWAESGPGFECLPLLEGKEESEPSREPLPDVPGLVQLTEEAGKLPAGTGLVLSLQIKSPPVTRIEKTYYPLAGCHYRLTIDVRGQHVTFNDMTSARQDYLYAQEWPTFLFAPILQWPELTPLWETLEVREFDWNKAMKKRKYEGVLRDDLKAAAREALEQAFDPEEAEARRIKLRK